MGKKKQDRPPLPDGWVEARDEAGRLIYFDENNRQVCGAYKSKRGSYCRAVPYKGSNKCYYHGGASPKGEASPHFVHGRRSRYVVPPNLIEDYKNSIHDPDVIDLTENIALIDARINELLRRADSGEDGAERWIGLKKHWGLLQDALRREDGSEASLQMRIIDGIIGDGVQDAELWNEVMAMNEKRRKIVDTHRRVQEGRQKQISGEQMVSILAWITAMMREEISDKQVLARIAGRMREKVGSQLPMMVVAEDANVESS